ncbi:glycosyltransferase family 4 protein [Candidatus Kaiserbacteria bacterium]|nr:glycosyltransferase family 4 protein [Candidatus Kaiserbacteria bacterium]
MKLLVCTQSVDTEDLVLGFFVGWLKAFEKTFGTMNIIALQVGQYDLKSQVHSLGKERGSQGRLRYSIRFLLHVWKLRREYDAVFVHMNEEYALLAGWLWKLLGKKVYLWRNHYEGSLATDIAAFFCEKVFCTSKFSYTAKYKKTVLMPIGIDTALFQPLREIRRVPGSLLFFGRFAPSKRPDVLVSAVRMLHAQNIPCSVTFFGSALARDAAYKASVQADSYSLENARFFEGVPHAAAPSVFSEYEIFVDLSESGMYNKTIFEAAACGCLVLAASKDFAESADARLSFDGSAETLAEKLKGLLSLRDGERRVLIEQLSHMADTHSLPSLVHSLAKEMNL